MTISNTIRTAGPYIGNDVTTAFPFYFKIFKTADLLVVQTDVATGLATPLVLNSGYTVTLNPDQNASPGGTATLPAALATGQTLVLTSALNYLQPLDITNGGGFYPAVLNAALDRLTIFCQQLFSLASRSLKLPLSDTGMNTELPSAAARANKLLGFDSLGRPIVSAPVSGSAAEVAIALANAIAAYLSSAGASLIGWIQRGVGASPRTLQDKNREFLSPADFGAVLDGVTDDTFAIQKAVIELAKQGGGELRFPNNFTGKCLISGTVIVPGYVTINLNGFGIIGLGIGINYVFESGYYDAPTQTCITNIGTELQSKNVLQMRIINGLILNCKGIRRQNCLDGCFTTGLSFTNCTDNLHDTACFYSIKTGLLSRGSSGLSEVPGFISDNNVNAQIMDSVSTIDRNIGHEFSGGVNSLSARSINAESGRIGIRVKDQLSAASFLDGYIELMTVCGFDLTDATRKENLRIDGYYFNNMPIGITGVQMSFGVTIGAGNHFVNVAKWVQIPDVASFCTVHVQGTNEADSGTPGIPATYELGPNVKAIGHNHIYDSGSGLPIACNIMSTGIVPRYYAGNAGHSPAGIPFCTTSSVTTTAPKFNVLVDSKIVFSPTVPYEFSITITDNIGPVKYWGKGSGTSIFMFLLPAGKTVTADNAAGFLRLTFGEHTHPTGAYSAFGVLSIA